MALATSQFPRHRATINFVVVPEVRHNMMAGSTQERAFTLHGTILAARLCVGVMYKKYFQAGLTMIPNRASLFSS